MVGVLGELPNSLYYLYYKKLLYKKLKNQNKLLKTIFDIVNKIKRMYTVNV